MAVAVVAADDEGGVVVGGGCRGSEKFAEFFYSFTRYRSENHTPLLFSIILILPCTTHTHTSYYNMRNKVFRIIYPVELVCVGKWCELESSSAVVVRISNGISSISR